MKKFAWCLVLAAFAAPAAAQAANLEKITARDAVKIAREHTGYGTELDAWHEFATDDFGKSYYVVDFVKCDSADEICYFKKRVLIEPSTGEVVLREEILKEWQGLTGMVPDAFDPVTMIERRRPRNDRVVSGREARKAAVIAAGLGEDYKTSVRLREDEYGTIRYVVDFLKCKSAACFWVKRAVVDPYSGKIETDPEIIRSFDGDGSLPRDLDMIPSTRQVLTPMERSAIRYVTVLFLLILVGAVVVFFARKRIAKWQISDYVFCVTTILMFMLAGALYCFYPHRLDYLLMCLSTSIFCLIFWMMMLENKKMIGIYDDQDLTISPPSALHDFSKVGGMEEVKRELRETLGRMIENAHHTASLNITFNGILLYGPPGVGKTYIVKAAAGQFKLNLINVKVSDMTSSFYAGSVRKIDKAFKAALKNTPCILFFDELESLGARRGTSSPLMEDTRITNHLLHWIEEIRTKKRGVYVLAATNRKEDLDEALIRPGRFDKHIFIPLPDAQARESIIRSCLAKRPSEEMDIANLSARMDGASAANIDAIINRASLNAVERKPLNGAPLRVTYADIVKAIDEFRAKRKNTVKPMVWDDVILQADVKSEISRLVKIIENPEATRQLGITPPKGVLLYGPPGTGKTTIAKVIAHQAKASFFTITQSDIYSKWLGESQQNVKKIFQEARNVRPSIVFIDEIDAIMGKRGSSATAHHDDQIASQILQEIDGMEDTANVFIIGATNAPDALDAALLRGGRLSIQIEVPLPGPVEREQLFRLFLGKLKNAEGIRYDDLVAKTDGHSGADIREICNQAILNNLDAESGKASAVDHQALVSAIQHYRRRSSVYKVPDHFRKTKIGFSV